MSGFSLNTITSKFSPIVAAADQKASTAIANLASDQSVGNTADIQSAKSGLEVAANLQTSLTQAFTRTTGEIIDKLV